MDVRFSYLDTPQVKRHGRHVREQCEASYGRSIINANGSGVFLSDAKIHRVIDKAVFVFQDLEELLRGAARDIRVLEARGVTGEQVVCIDIFGTESDETILVVFPASLASFEYLCLTYIADVQEIKALYESCLERFAVNSFGEDIESISEGLWRYPKLHIPEDLHSMQLLPGCEEGSSLSEVINENIRVYQYAHICPQGLPGAAACQIFLPSRIREQKTWSF